jgi:MFS family permease
MGRRPTTGGNARHGVLYFAFSLGIVTYLDRICIASAAPSMRKELGLSVVEMSFVFGAFTLAYSLFEVPTGWLGDVIGPRRVLTRIVLWWSGFTALTGAAWSYASLLTIRFLFGAGEAGAFPNASRSFARWFPASERGRATAVLFLGSRLGGALAPGLSLFVMARWGWRAAFVLFGLVGVVWAVAWYRWYRDDPAQHDAVSPDELAWIRGEGRSDPSAGAAGPAPTPLEREPGVEVPWRRLVSSPNLWAICGMYFGFGYGLYFYFTWLPTYLIQVLGFSALAGGLLAGLPFLLAGTADVAGGWLTDRLTERCGLKVGRCGIGFMGFCGSAVLLVLSTLTRSALAKAVLIAFALGSADLALSAAWAVCLDIGRKNAGVVTGFMNTFGNLGGFVGPIAMGFAVSRWSSWDVPFYITAGLYAAGALLWLVIEPREQLSP